MKTLKIISVISFLLIEGIQLHGTLNIGILFIYIFQLIQDVLSFSNIHTIFWEGILAILIVGTLITFLVCRKYSDKYILLFCFIALLFSTMYISGVFNYDKITIGFIIPLSLFVISSIWLIILNFKKPVIENKEA
ncbi:hypothetical protein GCM10022217_17200 [Chryseobacterium ginsenosidimutans]